jgi:hypothetical protein
LPVTSSRSELNLSTTFCIGVSFISI